MANTYLYRTMGTPTDSKKYTYSLWVKRGTLANQEILLSAGTSSSDGDFLVFRNTDQIEWQMYHSGNVGILKTNRLFKDVGAWYHIQIVYDSANATAGDRMKMYINGVEETSFATDTQPTLNLVSRINSAVQHNIGYDTYGLAAGYFTGSLSHVQFVDGLALAPTEFGSVDATSGIWKIKTGSYGTAGANGFHLKMEDSSNLDLDSSSNAHTFTTSGTLTATKDNPSDNFCTLHKLNPQASPSAVTNGNLTTQSASDSTWRSSFGTLANSTGKFYFEAECDAVGSGAYIGVLNTEQQLAANTNFKDQSLGYAYKYDGEKFNNSTGTSYGSTYTSGDIIGIAFDATNGTIWFSKNGAWQNSATIGEIAAGTTTNAAFSGISVGASKFFSPAISGIVNQIWKFNFGNGYFGTTAITSAGTNASEIGSFEYDVPTNFTAISTKGFNE